MSQNIFLVFFPSRPLNTGPWYSTLWPLPLQLNPLFSSCGVLMTLVPKRHKHACFFPSYSNPIFLVLYIVGTRGSLLLCHTRWISALLCNINFASGPEKRLWKSPDLGAISLWDSLFRHVFHSCFLSSVSSHVCDHFCLQNFPSPWCRPVGAPPRLTCFCSSSSSSHSPCLFCPLLTTDLSTSPRWSLTCQRLSFAPVSVLTLSWTSPLTATPAASTEENERRSGSSSQSSWPSRRCTPTAPALLLL